MAPMPTPRLGLAAAALNGKIYVAGGSAASGYESALEEYDPASNTWTSRAPMPTARGYLAVVEEYDPSSDAWITRASMPEPRQYLTAATLTGRLYAIGGSVVQSSTAVEYDQASDTWSRAASMGTSGHSCAVVNDMVYVIGDDSGGDSVAQFAPWAVLSPMPTRRFSLAAAAVDHGGGKVYAIGGGVGGYALGTNEEFDTGRVTLFAHRRN
jgi:N-acetylneuraminic acid mutarotase